MDKLLHHHDADALRKHRASNTARQASTSDAGLRKQARIAELRHSGGLGLGDPDPDRKIEIGEVETQLGRVRVTHDRGNDALSIHGISASLSEIAPDLRQAIVATSASFAAAETNQEQSDQRAVIGIVIDEVLRRHQFLTAKVREQKFKERWDV